MCIRAPATEKAWFAASGRSSPEVVLTTSERERGAAAGSVESVTRPSVVPRVTSATACRCRPAGRIARMSPHTLELIFLGLLLAATVTITWFAGYVVYKLFKGQR